MDPLLLGRDVCLHILRLLDAQTVLSIGACSKGWRRLTSEEDALWLQLCQRDQPAALHCRRPPGVAGWAAAYRRVHRLLDMREVGWVHLEQGRGRPRPREGHAACSWGRHGMLLMGGFGGGILSDLHLLKLPTAGHGQQQGSASGSGGGAGDGRYLWLQPPVSGRPPIQRYGHTLTRCGAHGELAVVFGGMMAGGYQAPLDTIAVLRRKPRPAPGGQPTAGAAGADAAWCRDGGAGGGGREEDTSLALRLAEAAPGGGAGAAWAQMLLAYFDQQPDWAGDDDNDDEEDEGMEEDSEEDEDEYAESTSSGSEDWGAGSSSGSDAAAASDEEDAAQAEGSPAAAAPAAAAPSGSDSVGLPAAGGSGASVPAPAPAGGSRGGSPAAAGGTGWEQLQQLEEEGEREEDSDAELEWFYPAVSGEPPGSRGYHSAAVSEDGLKIYFFGGISPAGSCDSLAVLDVATWRFSRPVTSGLPPPRRCGHSAAIYRGRLWVVGGGSGRDLLRSGCDLSDVHCLDLDTMEWTRLDAPAGPLCSGKCHSSVLVGSRLCMFGGSMTTCNQLAWLDLEALYQASLPAPPAASAAAEAPANPTSGASGSRGPAAAAAAAPPPARQPPAAWGAPRRVHGPPPCARMSASAVLTADGSEVLLFGGFTFHQREVGDLLSLKLLPTEAELAGFAVEEARAARAAAALEAGTRRGYSGRW